MIRLQISTAVVAAVLGVVAIVPTVSADQYDKKITATFAQPIEVPGGITLQPGTYVFKLQDSQNDRHIVLIQNERENHTFAQIFATNDFRLKPTGKVQIQFSESAAGQPTRLKAIFWPGDSYGQAFEYKKEVVAQVTQTQTTRETAAVETAAAPAPAPEPAPEAPVETAQNTPPPAPEPAPAPVVTTPEPAPAPAPAPPVVAENTTPAVLPQTASSIPLLALIGLLSVGFALVLAAFTKRIV
jgi:LPXTG-motif cell wall-anchored protein